MGMQLIGKRREEQRKKVRAKAKRGCRGFETDIEVKERKEVWQRKKRGRGAVQGRQEEESTSIKGGQKKMTNLND